MKKFTFLAIMAMMAMFVFGQSVKSVSDGNSYGNSERNLVPKYGVKAMTQLYRSAKRTGDAGVSLWKDRLIDVEKEAPFLLAGRKLAPRFVNGEDVIVSRPQGEVKFYARKGVCYYTQDFASFKESKQVGYIEVVYGKDGKSVYFKDFISTFVGLGTWVRGSLSDDGKSIQIPTGQNLFYMEEKDCYMQLSCLVYNEATKTYDTDIRASEITVSIIDEKQLKLENTDKNHIVGVTYSNNQEWTYLGDSNTEYTLFEEELITPPAGLTQRNFVLSGKDAYGEPISHSIIMLEGDKEVYMQGLGLIYGPKSWVKGIISGDSITIPSGQFLGLCQGYELFYMVSGVMDGFGDITIRDLVFTLNEDKHSYSSKQALILGRSRGVTDFFDYISQLKLEKGPDITFSTDVIREQPEGEVKLFERKGFGYLVNFGFVFANYQDGSVMEITYAPDGKTVYLKDPISQIAAHSWVKGTIEGNKIIVPAFQCVVYEESFGAIMARLDMVEVEDPETGRMVKTFEPVVECKNIVFTVDATSGTIRLEDMTNEKSICGLIMTDNFKWPGFGDYATSYEPFVEELTTLPEGAPVEEWVFRHSNGTENLIQMVNVAIADDKIYINRLSEYDPELAIVGTIKNGKAIFPTSQYLGHHSDFFLFFASSTYTQETVETEYGAYEKIEFYYTPELEFDYDAQKKILSVPDGISFVLHCGDNIPQNEMFFNYFTPSLHPRFNLYVEKSIRPKDPIIEEYDDSKWKILGYNSIKLNIPLEDIEGEFIKPENMSYQLFTKTGGEIQTYILQADDYTKLMEDMETIPYNFTDEQDILKGGEKILLWQTGFEDIGVQSINCSDGKEVRSNRIWLKAGKEEVGIDEVTPDTRTVKEVTYYSLSGMRLSEPASGISLMQVIYTDGTVETTKVYRR